MTTVTYTEEEYMELRKLNEAIVHLQVAQSQLTMAMFRMNDYKSFTERRDRIAKDLDQLIMDMGEVYLTKESKE